jgi:hypothetical protein
MYRITWAQIHLLHQPLQHCLQNSNIEVMGDRTTWISDNTRKLEIQIRYQENQALRYFVLFMIQWVCRHQLPS